MSYANPLHPPLHSSHYSAFTSLGSAVGIGPTKIQFTSPSRRRLPQDIYVPTSKGAHATGRPTHFRSTVSFDYIGHSKQGVPMNELCTRSAHALGAMIQGAGDPVLSLAGPQRIMLRILWPGYGHVEWAQSIEVTAHTTRAQLGAAVASNFARFVEKMRGEFTTCAEWQLGPSRVRFEHLFLLSLLNVFDNDWQADVAIDIR